MGYLAAMVLVRPLVVLAVLLGSMAVAGADAPAPEATPLPTKTRAAHKPRGHASRAPKASDKCTTDEDCVLTSLADQKCCPTLCSPRPVSKASAEALAKYAASCSKHDECPALACAPPHIISVPACVSGKCVARVAPSPGRQ
jgi:hypothetical protein